MSEAPVETAMDLKISVQTEPSPIQDKKDLVDPRTISKNIDQEGRDKLAAELRQIKQKKDEINSNTNEIQDTLEARQNSLLGKIKDKLGIVDKTALDLQQQILEQNENRDKLPDPHQMLEAYYEKVAETPLTNQEKRDLLKPDMLSQLTTDEYIALWKRLNPHFLTHVTRQGFRDHNSMIYHSAGLQEFHSGFVGVVQDEKKLRAPMTLAGLKNRDEVSVKMFLSEWVLQAENEEEAKIRFDQLLHFSIASAPTYPDKTAVHFATQLVADDYYGGESGNEIFFVFPSDVLASQNDFAFNGWEKDFTRPQSETKWNDVFIWPNTVEDPGVIVDAGVVFLPTDTQVDPETGSKYASEVRTVDGKEKRVMVEDTVIKAKFIEWARGLSEESKVIQLARALLNGRDIENQGALRSSFAQGVYEELQKIGFTREASASLAGDLQRVLIDWKSDTPVEQFQTLIDNSSARYKRAENTISAKAYWEKYFVEHPDLKPKHIVYYNGDPSTAIYEFEQKNGIGKADTSEAEGRLLGFDDHHVTDVRNDPRSNQGHEELMTMGNRIIEDHFRNRV